MVRQLGLTGHVWLPGAVDNPFPFFRLARYFVLSSRYEGFGNVLVEAMATGCPVVAFDCAFGPAEIVDHMVDGVLVPVGRVDELARAMALVLADEGLQRRLMDAARKKVATWSLARTTGRWLEG
jgi:glycosyltransferase involved in cell wall biosynthesis